MPRNDRTVEEVGTSVCSGRSGEDLQNECLENRFAPRLGFVPFLGL